MTENDVDMWVLLRHEFRRLFDAASAPQHGQRGKVLTSARISRRRMVAIYLELREPYAGPAKRLVTDGGANKEILVTEGEKEFDVVSDTMEALSRDTVGRKHASVGAISGCVIRVVDARLSGDLEYMQAVEVSNFPWEPQGGSLCSQRTQITAA